MRSDTYSYKEEILVAKPFIIKERCAAQPDICPPMKECARQAISYMEDENEPLGGFISIDLDKCDGCGLCVTACCGHCIEMKEE
jgi:Pyruvate/2-oxoacid:ferredoxin oxidoreductase delta subunit